MMFTIKKWLKSAATVTTLLMVGLVVPMALAPAAEAASDGVRINSGGTSQTSRSLILPLNKAAIVELPRDAADVLIAQPTMVEAVVRSPRRVYILGMEVGQTNAFFFDSKGREILNLEIRIERDLDDLSEIYTRILPNARLQVEAVNDNIILRGVVANNSEAKQAFDIASSYVGDPLLVMNMLTIRERGQVMLKVRIVEMQRRLIKQLGIDSSGTAVIDNNVFDLAIDNSFAVNGSSLGGLNAAARLAANGNLRRMDLNFEAFEQMGLVRVLAEPNITAVSGEPASFLAGGEFPVPTASGLGTTTIDFKRYGVGLGFTPVVLSKGRINLKIKTEVSDLSATTGVTVGGFIRTNPDTGEQERVEGFTVPGLNIRTAETTVELPSGGSLAMAGLLQENIQSAVEGLPGLKDVAVLGQLFRSNDFLRNETELVIIVTPYLVEPTHLSNLSAPDDGFKSASDAEMVLLGKLESNNGMRPQSTDRNLQGPLGFIID
jgi:pilus assembly protein CpaC